MASMTALKVSLGVLSFITVAALAASFTFWRKMKRERRQMKAKMITLNRQPTTDQAQKAPLLDVPEDKSTNSETQKGEENSPQV